MKRKWFKGIPHNPDAEWNFESTLRADQITAERITITEDLLSPRIEFDLANGVRMRGWDLTEADREFLRSCNVRPE